MSKQPLLYNFFIPKGYSNFFFTQTFESLKSETVVYTKKVFCVAGLVRVPAAGHGPAGAGQPPPLHLHQLPPHTRPTPPLHKKAKAGLRL